MNYLDKTPLLVKTIVDEAKNISSFEFTHPDGDALPEVTAGAHLIFHLENGLTRQYSLTNKAGKRDSLSVSILRDPQSRGGSEFFHSQVKEGDTVTVSGPKNHFPLILGAAKNLLIGGGIGITPVLSMARTLHATGQDFVLHYCAKSVEEAAFVEELKNCDFADRVHFHFDGGDPSKGADLKTILKDLYPGQHLYCCGPNGLMDAVEAAASHWPRGSVHFERFKAEAVDYGEDRAFTIEIASDKKKLEVPKEKTALQVLNENGYEVDAVCEEGVCGSCLVNVVDGEIEHRDQILDDDEKKTNEVMLVCCSRAKSDTLTIDL